MTTQTTTVPTVHIDGDVCRLDGVINFQTAPALHEAVTQHLSSGRHITLDFSGVTQANSAGLALLLEWKERALGSGGSVSHQNLPESLRQLSEICQVSTLI